MWPFSDRAAGLRLLAKRLQETESRVTLLEERQEALALALERLRGRFYASGMHKREPDADHQPQTKAEILREFFKPGQPTRHT